MSIHVKEAESNCWFFFLATTACAPLLEMCITYFVSALFSPFSFYWCFPFFWNNLTQSTFARFLDPPSIFFFATIYPNEETLWIIVNEKYIKNYTCFCFTYKKLQQNIFDGWSETVCCLWQIKFEINAIQIFLSTRYHFLSSTTIIWAKCLVTNKKNLMVLPNSRKNKNNFKL